MVDFRLPRCSNLTCVELIVLNIWYARRIRIFANLLINMLWLRVLGSGGETHYQLQRRVRKRQRL